MAEREGDESNVAVFELLMPIVENIKLLVLGPFAVGLLAFGIAFFLPKTYTSQSYLTLGDQEVKAVESIMRSPAVLDVLLNRYPARAGITDAGREELSKRIRISGGGGAAQKPGNVVVKLEVDEESPERAQAVANALIDAWLETTKPRPATKLELERKLKLAQDALADTSRIISRLASETPKLVMPNLQYELAQPMSQLLKLRNDYVNDIAGLELALKGRSRDVIASEPTLPDRPAKPRKALVAVLSALVAGALLLALILVRHLWRHAAQDPQVAALQGRLRSAVGLK